MAYGVNAPFGLKPSRMISGATWNGQTTEYLIRDQLNVNIFTGDPVTPSGTGGIGRWAPNVLMLGAFMGCKYLDAKGNAVFSPYWPAGTVTFRAQGATAFVVDDPNVLFDIQISDSTNVISGLQFQDLNLNADLAVGGGGGAQVPQNPAAGSTLTGQSAYYLDYNSAAANAGLAVKIMNLTPYPGNVFATQYPVANGIGAYNNALVYINNHVFHAGTAGV